MVMKVIASIIGFFAATSEASNNRMLLQGQGQAQPTTTAYTYVAPPLPSTPITELMCTIAAGQPGSCAGGVVHPPQIGWRFSAICDGVASCAGSTLNIFYSASNTNWEAEGLWFTGVSAAADATVNFGNYNPTMRVDLPMIECSEAGSCFNTKFNFMGVDLGDFVCQVPGACDGCTITFWDDPAHPLEQNCVDVAKLAWL